jgi:TP901 family phage tail tape measure protein
MDGIFQLGVVITLQDVISSQIGSVNEKFGELKKTLGETHFAIQNVENGFSLMKAGMLATGVVTGFAMALKPAVDEARAFEKELAMLGATSEVSATDLKKLESAAIKAGIETQFSPQEAVKGLTALASAGITGADALKESLVPALDLAGASAGKLSIDDAASSIAASMSSFKKPAQEVSDIFVRMANLGSFNVEDIGAAWRGVNLAASSANQSMATTGAVMIALKNSGSTVVEAGEGARMALERFSSKEAIKHIDALKVSLYEMKDGKEQVRNMVDIFQDIDRATSQMGEKQRKITLAEIFGSGGIKAFQAVIGQGISSVKNWEESLGNSQGAAHSFAEKQINTFDGATKMFEGSMQTLKVLIGSVFLPILSSMARGFTNILGPALEWMQTHPLALQYAVGLVSVAGAVSLLVGVTATYVGAMKAYTAIKAAAMIANIDYQGSILLNTAAIFYQIGAKAKDTVVTWALVASYWGQNLAASASVGAQSAALASMNASGIVKAGLIIKTYALTAAEWALNSAILANPMTWVVVAIVAAVAAVVAAIYYWDEWTGAIRKAWQEHQIIFTALSLIAGPIGYFLIAVNLLADNWERLASSVKKSFSAVSEFFGFSTKNETGLMMLLRRRGQSCLHLRKQVCREVVNTREFLVRLQDWRRRGQSFRHL